MLEDLLNKVTELTINDKKYTAEYDFKSYAELELKTGQGFYKLYDKLMVENNLTLSESIEIICCALIKHHKKSEIDEVREYLQSNLYAISDINSKVIGAFVAPILAPELMDKIQDLKKKLTEVTKEQPSSIG